MDNYSILQHYSRTDLRRLAKGKISEIVGLDANKILVDLSRVLGNYESVKRHVEFRTPPADTILEVLLQSPGHQLRVDDLKPAVKARIRQYRASALELALNDPVKGYRLYAKMLSAAWDYEGDLMPAEANLLRVLRGELGITRRGHQLIMAHPDVGRLAFDNQAYEEELTFLSNEGIILVCRDEEETYFVLSDETAESLLQLWGFEMEQSQYERLLAALSNTQMSSGLKSAGLRSSGTRTEFVSRIIENELAPSDLLDTFSAQELSNVLAKLGLPRGGNKEERVLRLTDYFKSDADLAVESEEEADAEVAPEPELLREETLADLLSQLDVGQLADILDSLDLPKSGAKAVKIDRLVQSRFNAETILQSLVVEDLRGLAGKQGIRKTCTKGELVRSIIGFFQDEPVPESAVAAKDLLGIYEELARQDRRAYPADLATADLSATRIGLDFERATRYLFKNLLRLDTKTQQIGREDPDGTITDEDDLFYCYECKTVFSPPYSLPIQHRLQIRNYISAIADSRRADRFGGYIVIAHSFVDNIEEKLTEIKPALSVPVAAVSAADLLAFAQKWQADHPIDTYPIGRALRHGLLSARDLNNAVNGF